MDNYIVKAEDVLMLHRHTQARLGLCKRALEIYQGDFARAEKYIQLSLDEEE